MVGLQYLREWWSLIPTPLKALAGGTAGTLFGAWLTARAQQKRELVAELRALRSSHNSCLVIANQCMAAKKQLILPVKGAHEQARRDFDIYQAGPKSVPLNIFFEFYNLPEVNTPIEVVQKLAFEKCDLGAKGLSAAAELGSAISGLNTTIVSRNELLKELRLNSDLSDLEIFYIFSGVRNPQTRRIDERYTTMVQALESLTNDCLFFARQLAAECIKHANLRAKKNCWKYKLPYKTLEPADWSLAMKEGLLPPDEDYQSWLRGFREEKSLSWWHPILRKDRPKRTSGSTKA